MSPYGILGEYRDAETLLAAIEASKNAGFSEMEAYTPMPVHEVSEALGYETKLPLLILVSGIVGAIAGFGLQCWIAMDAYPVDVGGRPLFSWPAFIVVSFEMTILFAAVAAVLGMLALNGLPMPHHPLFAVDAFQTATRDRFFLLILDRDPNFDAERIRSVLSTDSLSVHEVPR